MGEDRENFRCEGRVIGARTLHKFRSANPVGGGVEDIGATAALHVLMIIPPNRSLGRRQAFWQNELIREILLKSKLSRGADVPVRGSHRPVISLPWDILWKRTDS